MTRKKIRTVLFDLDGTLADTAPDLAFALNSVLEELGRRPLSYDVIRPIVSHGSNALIYLAFELDPGDEGFDPIRDRLLEIYSSNIARETSLFPGMDTVLETLESHGINWGVVTNKPGYLTDPLMKALGLYDRASCVVSGDTTSKCKPHPEPMHYAALMVGSEPAQCLYIGDAKRDIEAGRNAGMPTLAALFGYIGDHDSPDEWGADASINAPLEILERLKLADKYTEKAVI
ncbi:HAD family hydrolase [Pseudomonadota bacterium]